MRSFFIGAAIAGVLLATPTQADATGFKCRTYVPMPISMAVSTANGFVLASSITYRPTRLRGAMGPHHYAALPYRKRGCRTKVAHRRGAKRVR